ncbi:MAG: hypothetical protein IKX43_01945 [Paludibacteraceae bacterium]|jgi:hypothetical protein|nr:hypothetical protein [Paludibacteraceae bacterium]
MRGLFLILGLTGFLSVLCSCTKKDCDCTFYNAAGEEVPSYSGLREEMNVNDCADLNTSDSTGYFICK